MNRTLSYLQYSIAATTIAILFLLRHILLGPDAPCIVPPILFVLLVGYVYSHVLLYDQVGSWLLGILLTLLVFPLAITPVYWIFGYASWYPLAVSIVQLCIGGILVWRRPVPWPKLKQVHTHIPTMLLGSVTIGIVLILSLFLLSDIFGDTILSPWVYIGKRYWVLTATAIILSLYATKQIRTTWFHYLLLASWYLAMYNLLLFSHPIAFGFDQHIHLASMRWILAHGLLEPKVPYYLGQYFLAIPIAELMNISLDWVSRSLVPMGTVLFLPLFLLRTRLSTPILFFLPLVPLSVLTFTTPSNLALLIALLTLVMIWSRWQRETRSSYLLVSVLLAWALITHAFVGIPLVCMVGILYSRTIWQQVLCYVVGVLSLPTLLILYGGATLTGFDPTAFFALLAQPHYYIGMTSSFFWHALYTYKVVLLWLLGSLMIVGSWTHWGTSFGRRLIVSISMVLTSSILIAASIRFPGLLTYEQGDYASRLLSLTAILCIPFVLLGLQACWRYTTRFPYIKPFLLLCAVLLLLISYYFTYPTRDPISYYTGVNIRPADIEAITFIEQHTNGKPYIVLTNQTISAAALSTYGFDRYIDVPSGTEEYFYAIPTGGPLYQYFRKYIYEGYDRSSIEEAMEFAGVDHAYLIHTNYWAPAAEIRDVSKHLAGEWWVFGANETWVFEFTK